MPQTVLLAEDDRAIRHALERALTLEGYEVTAVADGVEALAQAHKTPPDVLVLDVMMPGIDGLQVCRVLRAEGDRTPILMLTALVETADRIAGLDAGADDYVVKPFDLDELLARVRAFGRRARAEKPPTLRFAGLTLDPSTREAWRGERKLALTPREFELLELFLRHPRQALTRELISDRVWGYDYDGESNVIDVCVKYLREKLEAGGEPRLIQTVRGVGYALREEP